jgi:secreted Zn-dependent insulinase-like peptidase
MNKGGNMNGLTGSNFTAYPLDMPDQEMMEDVLKRLVDFIVNPGFFI